MPRPRPGTGQAAIIPSPGPLGRSVDDLVLVMRAWLVEKMWAADPGIPRLPFRLNVWEGRKKLRVGYVCVCVCVCVYACVHASVWLPPHLL